MGKRITHLVEVTSLTQAWAARYQEGAAAGKQWSLLLALLWFLSCVFRCLHHNLFNIINAQLSIGERCNPMDVGACALPQKIMSICRIGHLSLHLYTGNATGAQ